MFKRCHVRDDLVEDAGERQLIDYFRALKFYYSLAQNFDEVLDQIVVVGFELAGCKALVDRHRLL